MTLGVSPEVAFSRLAVVLRGHREHGELHVGSAVGLPPAMASACRVIAVERPNVLVLEREGGVLHSIVVAPADDGAEIVWTSARGEGTEAEVEGVLTLLDLALADRSPPAQGARAGRTTVLDQVALDHHNLRTRLDRLIDGSISPTRAAVTGVLADVARHEAAESALLRPLLRRTAGGGPVAQVLDRQERCVAASSHAVVTAAITEDPTLPEALRQLRTAVLDNCDAEEVAAHPRLRADCSVTALEELGQRYVAMTRVDVDRRHRRLAS